MTLPPRVLAYAGTHPPFCTHMSFPPARVLAHAGTHPLPTHMSFPPTPSSRMRGPIPLSPPTCHSPPPRVLASGPIPRTHMSGTHPRVLACGDPSPFLHPHVIPPSPCPRVEILPPQDGGRGPIPVSSRCHSPPPRVLASRSCPRVLADAGTHPPFPLPTCHSPLPVSSRIPLRGCGDPSPRLAHEEPAPVKTGGENPSSP